MSDTKMLQAILSTVLSLKEDNKRIEKKVDENDRKLTSRLDKIGLQLAYIEDDTPTMDDHKKLARRVKKLEIKLESISNN